MSDATTFTDAVRTAARLDAKCRALESQNQALQEHKDRAERALQPALREIAALQERAEKAEARAIEMERLKDAQKNKRRVAQRASASQGPAIERLKAQNQALQEAVQRALDRYDREDDGTLKVRDGLTWAMAQDLRNALSPTQETDHMADVMTYTDAGWPHGARCSRCGQLFTEGQVMAEELDSVRGDGVPVVEVSHRTCEPHPGD